MPTLELKPTHKVVAAYYDNLAKFARLGIKHEGAVRSAFHELLEHCARQFDWKLVPEYAIKRKGQADAKADGALLDNYGLNHGLWEAKDSADDLDKEIKHKFSIGYPKQNILFWQPDRAVLYQNSERFYEADLTKPDDLVHVLTLFLEFAPPAIAEWEKAVEEFRDKVPQIGRMSSRINGRRVFKEETFTSHGCHSVKRQQRHRIETGIDLPSAWNQRLAATPAVAGKTRLHFSPRAARCVCGWLLLARVSETRANSRQQPELLASEAESKQTEGQGCYKRIAERWLASATILGTRPRQSRGCREEVASGLSNIERLCDHTPMKICA